MRKIDEIIEQGTLAAFQCSLILNDKHPAVQGSALGILVAMHFACYHEDERAECREKWLTMMDGITGDMATALKQPTQ